MKSTNSVPVPSIPESSTNVIILTGTRASGGVAGARSLLRLSGSRIFFPFDGNEFRHARLLHRDTVKDGAHLHRLAIVRDNNELRLPAHIGKHFVETGDVGFVERRIDLIENAEWAWLVTKHGNQQRERRERLFPARQQENILKALTR